MKKRMMVVVVATLLAVSALWHQATAATPEEAKDLVIRAADELKKVGKAKAYTEFSDTSGPFRHGDLYVFVFNFNGVWEAYPPKPDAVGISLLDIKDVDGKEFVKEMISVAKTSGEGWVDYKWKNPETKKIQPKTSYIKTVDDVFVGAGVYK